MFVFFQVSDILRTVEVTIVYQLPHLHFKLVQMRSINPHFKPILFRLIHFMSSVSINYQFLNVFWFDLAWFWFSSSTCISLTKYCQATLLSNKMKAISLMKTCLFKYHCAKVVATWFLSLDYIFKSECILIWLTQVGLLLFKKTLLIPDYNSKKIQMNESVVIGHSI